MSAFDAMTLDICSDQTPYTAPNLNKIEQSAAEL